MLTIRTNYLLNMILKVIFKVIQIIMWEVHRWQMKDYRRCVSYMRHIDCFTGNSTFLECQGLFSRVHHPFLILL